MASADINVISHLLDVEKQASDLIRDASIEAEKRVSEARARADEEFKKQFEEISTSLEDEYNKKIEEISKNHEKQFLLYTSVLAETEQDKESFQKKLKQILQEM